ncbi:A/G-specific adenine glycosylase [Marinisporobacter balticus]|uniref:Adenine DNA glycosylase n=1 Tax=Marinisporobacter balticus TaxID=2018667 RepID=A0A4R2KIT4_9FIRM|nr:A/G-specific adenine glycosylase [Marinisporobacter balticus]TCO73124.1 A/G-specific DNA-adenine glycosylase [Marinisporobacter balticus]
MTCYTLGAWKNINKIKIENIQKHLNLWYEKNHRKLPWRETNNPYYIWISEVMLQQTRVDTVIPYFLNFINKFPNIESLAYAHEEEVLKMWEGLGYYSRAKNLHRGAKVIVEDFNGNMPDTLEEIKKIPGIGPYTAGAILSIAYGKRAAAVDGNVMRVFSRLFYIKEDIAESKTRKEMEKIGGHVVSPQNPSFFNQGLMELGALICTPTSPKCIACPLFLECSAKSLGVQETLPIKKKKPKVKTVEVEMAIVYKKKKLLIMKRSTQGLLANLWAVPATERELNFENGKSIRLELEENYGMKVTEGKFQFEKKHIFTHLKWKMKIYFFKLIEESPIDDPEIKWILHDEIEKYVFPTAFMKILKEIESIKADEVCKL